MKFRNALILCVSCLALNIAVSLVARVVRSPFFFDTIFTVTATFFGGLVPGLIIALVFNPVMTLVLCGVYGLEISVYDSFYALCGVVIVLVTWFFSRDKESFYSSRTNTFIYLMIIAIASALASSFIASVLDAFVRPFFVKNSGLSPIDGFSSSFENLNLGSFLSFFLPRVPVTFVDRLICTFAGYLICRGLVLISNKKLLTSKE